MGVYVRLDIMPDKIDVNQWRKVYEESLALLKAYPFATLASDSFNGVERWFMDIRNNSSSSKNENMLYVKKSSGTTL